MFGFFKKDEEPSDIPFNEYNHDKALDLISQAIYFTIDHKEEIIDAFIKAIKNNPFNTKVVIRDKEVAKRAVDEILMAMRKHSIEMFGQNNWNWGVMLPSCVNEAIEVLKSLYGYSSEWNDVIGKPFINIIEKNIAPLWNGKNG